MSARDLKAPPGEPRRILSINGGSSSIKFALYRFGEPLTRELYGQIERLGSPEAALHVLDTRLGSAAAGGALPEGAEPVGFLIDWLERNGDFASIAAVGHRIVQGMQHAEPEPIGAALLRQLRLLSPYDPEHLPRELALIEAFRTRHPRLPQIACFDSAFHRRMPRVAQLLAIPRRYQARGLQRYGFHGLSYAYLMEELARLGDPAAHSGRVILAHLGNGASMAAVRDGVGIETTMGFTPSSGLPMSTRSGDLDPGLLGFLGRSERMSVARIDHMLTHESGLLGVSGLSGDVRELLDREQLEAGAAEALALFCYQAKKCIGALAAALGGLDTLVFAGGIGENSAPIRERICADLVFLGITLDAERNARHAALIGAEGASVTARVIHTDEEQMIARSTARLLDRQPVAGP